MLVCNLHENQPNAPIKILFLTNNLDITSSLYDWLRFEEGHENVVLWQKALNPALLEDSLADTSFLVSYNYKHILPKTVISLFPRKAINLHISMLPWNRGASPNLWSFVHDTPKGVTIHVIDEGLDTGDILLQQQIFFDESVETFESSYFKLHESIQRLFCDNWQSLKCGKINPVKQGSVRTLRETADFIRLHGISWSERITDVKQRIITPPPRKNDYLTFAAASLLALTGVHNAAA